MFAFYFQRGSGRRQLFQSTGELCSIGSARGNDLVIDSRQISKRQAELTLKDNGVYLRDLGSLSGCWVNKERVKDFGPLSELDEVEVGDVRLSFKSIRFSGLVPHKLTTSQQAEDTVKKSKILTDQTSQNDFESLVPEHDQSDKGSDMAYWGRIVHEQLLYQMDLQRKDVNRMSDDALRMESKELIRSIVNDLDEDIPQFLDREVLKTNVLNESVGLGPLEEFLDDESVTEIMVNNHREIFIERQGKLERSVVSFSSDSTVSAVIDRIISPLGRRIDESSPIVDARLKDGSRVNAIIPPLALKGPSLTIRKFPKHRLEFNDLIAANALSKEMVDFLHVCVQTRKNIIVSGGTGSGKTTLLNALSGFIPSNERIVTIEDAAELKLIQPNLVSLESRPPNLDGRGAVPIRDLVKNSLRMRPDRIVVGECRGGEALDMLQAMNTGHNGSLTTIHANNPRDVLSRLEVLVLMAGMELPIVAIREQVASAVDLIIQQTRFPCGARKITRISEVVGMESGTVQLQDIFKFQQRSLDEEGRVVGHFEATGAIPTFYEELRYLGYEVDLGNFSNHRDGGSA
ncbi:MAG: ATPase, T2SS/T4P/T4SS family [Granulosicoccus sp.]